MRTITIACALVAGGGLAATRCAARAANGPSSRPVVCIDPGHPSETSNGASRHGLSERHINWLVAQLLRNRLDKDGIAVVLTKPGEKAFVTNRQRAEIANRAHASLFVRLHCDSAGGRGFAWYYPDRSARKQGVTGPPVFVQRASRQAAFFLNGVMAPLLQGVLHANPVRSDAATRVGSRQGGVLTGSIFARVPTVLIEMGDLTNAGDRRYLASTSGREKLAGALDVAIERYIRRESVALPPR